MPRPTPIIRKVLVTAAVLLAALAGGLVYVVQPIGWRSSGARPGGVDPVRLEAHVRMLAETLAPRHWKRQDNLDRAAAYVAARLGEAGARVTEQVYAVEAAGRYRNVIGSFGPEAGERVIVGAHYDGAGPFAAADDNASGVAGLLELARLLGTGRTPSTRNFVAVIGRLGEAQLARRVKRAMQDATDLDVYSMNAPAWIPGIDFSDHRSYWAQGYSAVMVTDTAFYRNDRYHTPRDTPDTLDYRRMADVVRGVHRAVLTLAR